jgi:hypothetical protein
MHSRLQYGPRRQLALIQGARPMLSEIYMLRLEAILRASNAPVPGSNSDTRFVPIKSPVSPTKDLRQAGK